jgi:FdhD protein
LDAKGIREVDVHAYGRGRSGEERRARVVVEEPLVSSLSGDTLAMTMSTPGHDHELCAGLGVRGGLIRGAMYLGSIRHCRDEQGAPENVIDISPAPGTVLDLDGIEQNRSYLRSSSCGLCGRVQIDDLLSRVKPPDGEFTLERELIHRRTRDLRASQPNFSATGGVHAAGVLDSTLSWLVVREDVGRHNAVDKVLGRLLLDGILPPGSGTVVPRALIVSGRVSFEIVQKALVARLHAVIGVSAPSSLAIETARRARMTLVGFSREDSFNVYSGRHRLP